MVSILRFFALFMLLAVLALAGAGPIPTSCSQLVVVVSPDWDSPSARLQRYQRRDGQWTAVGAPMPARLGAKGLAWGRGEHRNSDGPLKREGDLRAPAGVFRLGDLWLRQGIAAPSGEHWRPKRIQPDTVAVDDPHSRHYNRIVRTSQVSAPDWNSRERMDIPDYDRVLLVGHNLRTPVPGAGSCIFVHRWETPETRTSGCTALSEADLITVLDWLDPELAPRLVQLPQALAEHWSAAGWIPAPPAR